MANTVLNARIVTRWWVGPFILWMCSILWIISSIVDFENRRVQSFISGCGWIIANYGIRTVLDECGEDTEFERFW